MKSTDSRSQEAARRRGAETAGSQKTNAQEGAMRGFTDAVRAFARALEDASAPAELQRRLEDAQRTYERAMQDAWVPPRAADRLAEGQRAFLTAMQEGRAPEDVHQRFEIATRDHIMAMRAAWALDEFQKRVDEASRTYLRHLKEAWQQVGDAMDHRLLGEIGQGLLAAAQLACTAEAEGEHRRAAVAQLAACLPAEAERPTQGSGAQR